MNPEVVIVGKIGAPFGVRGWVKIHSFTDPTSNILTYKPWLLSNNTVFEPINVLKQREQGNGLVAQFEGCEDRDAAKALTHRDIGILREQLPDTNKGEYYWADLMGLTVINKEQVTLGLVDHLFDTGAGDVMIVKGEKEHLIPFVLEHTIVDVDLKNKYIRVDWDETF